MKKINESQLAARVNNLRDYLSKIDEAPLYNMDPQNKPGATPAPTGNSFDAKLAQANAAAKAKGGRTGPAPVAKVTPDPKGPGARPNGWTDRMMGNDKRWDAQYAAKYNPDGTAKKGAVAVAKAKTPAAQQAADPALAPQAGTPAAATSVDAAKAAGAEMNKEPAQAAAPAATGPWPAGSPQATAWAALSPEDQKWLGGADPTDQMILARAPNGGKPAAAPGQGASPAPAQAVPGVKAGGEVVDTRGGLQGQDEMEESVTFQNDELNRIVSLIQHR